MAFSHAKNIVVGNRASPIAATLILVWATSLNGATEHSGALLLRILAGTCIVIAWPREPITLSRYEWLPPLAACAVVTVGTLSAPNIGLAMQSLISVGLVCALFFTNLLRPTGAGMPWLGPIATAASVHALWSVVQGVTSNERGTGGFFSPNDLAAVLAPVLMLSLHRLLTLKPTHDSSRRWSATWATTCVVLLAGIAATQSRSGILAATLGGVMLVGGHACSKGMLSTRRGQLWAAAAALGCVLILGAGTWARWDTSTDPYAFSRTKIWSSSVSLALEHPWGVGLGQYGDAMRVRGLPFDSALVRFPRAATNAHNEPLQAWSELGFAGLIACLLPPFLILWFIGRRNRQSPASSLAFPTTATAVLLTFAIPALVSASLHVPPVALLAACWAGSLLNANRPAKESVQSFENHRVIPLGALMLVLLALPGALSWLALERGRQYRARGGLEQAAQWGGISMTLAPWSLGPAMFSAAVGYQRDQDDATTGLILADLAELFPSRPEPLDKAAALVEQRAAALSSRGPADGRQPGVQEQWLNAATIRKLQAQRDPKNVTPHYSLALDLMRGSSTKAASHVLQQLLDMEPRCARALALSAAIAQDRGETEHAHRLAKRAMRADALSATAEGYPQAVLALDRYTRNLLIKKGLTQP